MGIENLKTVTTFRRTCIIFFYFQRLLDLLEQISVKNKYVGT